jgi:RNA polymerase sigma-70 factor (ECF subfamily)
VSETATQDDELRIAVGEQTRPRAARSGDEEAFRRIAEEHRAAVRSHCHRMLGSVHDAEDALQETMLRAWRGLSGFQGRSSPRSWLFRIATNVCIDAIKRRRGRVSAFYHGPPAGPGSDAPTQPVHDAVWVHPHPDHDLWVEDPAKAPEARYERRENIESAFIAALEHLPVRQRNVLILRDVLGFSAKETAEILETTVAAINSALQRARRAFDQGAPQRSRQVTARSLFDPRTRALVERFVNAVERGEIGTILAILAEDATLVQPSSDPASRRRHGHRPAASPVVAAHPIGHRRLDCVHYATPRAPARLRPQSEGNSPPRADVKSAFAAYGCRINAGQLSTRGRTQ